MKTKRLLSYLLVAVFVLGVLPLTVAAEELPNRKLTCELHVHDPAACYGLICELEEHTHSTDPGSTCTRVRCTPEEFPDHYYNGWHKQDLRGSKREGNGRRWWYECCTKAEHTHTETGENPCYGWTCGYTDHEHDEKCYEYKYVINYVLYLNGQPVDGGSGSTSGYAKLDETINADPTIDFEDITYALDGEQTTSMTIGVEGNTLNVRYSAEVEVPEEPEEPEETPPVNVPPQVIYPTPAPEIEVPEEEIPTTVPDETEIEEEEFEEEEFEDEEIPTDVPETGDASPIYTALALIALAGAAFALTFKKSRNNG